MSTKKGSDAIVVVIDDRIEQAKALVEWFKLQGVDSHAFDDPNSAVAFARDRGAVSLAIIDYDLGTTFDNGIRISQRFRDERLADEVLIMTPLPLPATDRELLKDLGVEVIKKPVDVRSLFAERLKRHETLEGVARPTEDASIEAVPKTIEEALGDIGQEIQGHRKDQQRSGRTQAVIALVGLVIAGIGAYIAWRALTEGGADTPGSTARTELILAENPVPLASITLIGRTEKYFETSELNVQVRSFSSGKLALDAVLGGAADVATVAETPLVYTTFAGLSPIVIATIASSSNDCKAVVRRDRGILSPNDLRGRRVATAIGTSAEYFMSAFLRGNGLSADDVTVVNLQPGEMVAALSRGDIDAFFIWEPYAFTAKDVLGDQVGVFGGQEFYTETYNIVTTEEFLVQNEELLRRFLEALFRAEQYIKAYPTDAIASVGEITGLPSSVLEGIWQDFNFEVTLDSSLADYMEEQARWAITSGRVSSAAEVPDFEKLLDFQVITQIDPSRARRRQ